VDIIAPGRVDKSGVLLHVEKMKSDIRFSDVKLEKEIGRGSFGSVYRATYKGHIVAAKVLRGVAGMQPRKEDIKEMRQEVAFLSGLIHAHLLSYVGACFEYPNLCFLTEYMAGGNLSDIIHGSEDGRMAPAPISRALQWYLAQAVASGVSFLHSRRS
jgi:serine/threonine protein kinase